MIASTCMTQIGLREILVQRYCWLYPYKGDEATVKLIFELKFSIWMQYFKHARFSSFQRQLNLYGFRKIDGAYHHKYFNRDRWAAGDWVPFPCHTAAMVYQYQYQTLVLHLPFLFVFRPENIKRIMRGAQQRRWKPILCYSIILVIRVYWFGIGTDPNVLFLVDVS